MNAFKSALLCVGLVACSHDRPAESAYDTQPVNEPAANTARTDGDGLTPASTTGERRAVRDDATSAQTAPVSGTPGAAANAPANSAPTHAGTTNAPAGTTNAPAGPTNAPAAGAATTPGASASTAAPDNSKRNERDRDGTTLTPGDQGNGEQDLRITQQIRQAVMDDKSLSFTAKNVKIITVNGKVTLRGPVNTAQERSAIEAAARKVAGVSQVDSQLEVKK